MAAGWSVLTARWSCSGRHVMSTFSHLLRLSVGFSLMLLGFSFIACGVIQDAPQLLQKYTFPSRYDPCFIVFLSPHLGHSGFEFSLIASLIIVVMSSLHVGHQYLGVLMPRISVYPFLLVSPPHIGHLGRFMTSPSLLIRPQFGHFHLLIFVYAVLFLLVGLRGL